MKCEKCGKEVASFDEKGKCAFCGLEESIVAMEALQAKDVIEAIEESQIKGKVEEKPSQSEVVNVEHKGECNMLGAKQGKVWGRTNLVFSKNNVSVHHVFITGHKHCSKHMHEHRYNMFYVLRGEILVKCWKNDYDLVDKTHLEEGEFTIVAPGEMHQFETGAGGCELLEMYFVELDDRDIIRETVGGENET